MLGAVPATPYDPETYLRSVGEEIVLHDPGNMWTSQRMPRVAEVLEAAGALAPDLAAKVLAEYATAFRLRGDARFWASVPRQAPLVALEPARVVLGPWEVKTGTSPVVVEQLRFATGSFSFKAHGFTTTAGVGRRRPGRGGRSPVPASLTVTGPNVTTAIAASSGASGWSDKAWNATFEVQTPLDPAMPWIGIAGSRIELPAAVDVAAEAWVEDVPAGEDPVRALLLWALARDATEAHGQDFSGLDEAVETLVATGIRPADDPALDEVRRVRDTISGAGSRRTSLLAPWSAWLRRRTRTDGRVGQLPLSVLLEDVEGCNLRFDALWSREDGFTLQLAVSPGTELLGHHPLGSRRRLVFWGEDDRANIYLGQPGNNGGSWEMVEGEVTFTGPLDPGARLLRILPTGRRRRGVIEVPLDELAG